MTDALSPKEIAREKLAEIGCSGGGSFVGLCQIEIPTKVNGKIINSSIGAFTYVQTDSTLIDTEVGRFCSIAEHVSAGAGEHPVDWFSTHPFVNDPHDVAAGLASCYPQYREWLGSKPSRYTPRGGDKVRIGHDVWIGEGAFIRRGITIGTGAIVAARAVVVKDVAPFSIVGGNPAKHIKFRIDEALIDYLLQSHWWDYDLRPLIRDIDFSNVPDAIERIRDAIEHSRIRRLEPARYQISPEHS